MLSPAEIFGEYRIERLLGAGSSATVFLAQNLTDQRWVALKIFAPAGLAEEAERQELRTRFLQEAQVLQRLRHPLPHGRRGTAAGAHRPGPLRDVW